MAFVTIRPGTLACLLVLSSVVLDTKGELMFTQLPEDKEAYIGQPAVSLGCGASASEGLTFDQWLHNDLPIGNNGSDYNVSHASDFVSGLEIRAFRSELAGEYRCQFSKDEGTHTDVVLTKPGIVRYFGQDGFSTHPVDFESYVLEKNESLIDYTLGRKPREVIAFECTYAFHPLSTQPDITWQTCNSDGTFTDLPVSNNFLPSPRDRIAAYTFFQSNFTSYLQISNSTDPAYNGSRFRCQAASRIPGDTAVVNSTCASVTQYHNSVPVPDTAILPVFRTIPKRNIYVTDTVDGIMACTIQNQPNLNNPRPLLVQNSNNQTVIINFFSLEPGVVSIGENNLRVDYFQLLDAGVVEATYTCRLDETGLFHHTTFHILREPQLNQMQLSNILTVSEDSSALLNLSLSANPVGYTFRVYRNGQPLTIDGSQYRYTQQSNLHTLEISSAQESDRGVFQLEVGNPTGTAVIYYHVRVNLKARPLTPNETIEAKVTQDLLLICEAAENGNGPFIDFEWKFESTLRQSLGINPASNLAIVSHRVSADLLLEDAGTYSCTPSNIVGSKGSTFYTVLVTKFDPPQNVSVLVNESSSEVIVMWAPISIDQSLYRGANVGEYVVELYAASPNGSLVKVATVNVSGDSSRAVFRVNSVQNYQARVQGRTGGRDVSDFSPLLISLPPSPTLSSTTATTFISESTPSLINPSSPTSSSTIVETSVSDYSPTVTLLTSSASSATTVSMSASEFLASPSPSSSPTLGVAAAPPEDFPGWAIFLILLFILIAILLLLLLLIVCCLCFSKRDPKGEYNAEKREEQYLQNMKVNA